MEENLLLLLVFLAAIFHATWNTIIKQSKDPLKNMALMQLIMGLAFLPLLFYIPIPNKEAWVFLIISIIFHTLYFTLLGLAYRSGDLSVIYPIARGLAPLIIFILMITFSNQYVSYYGGLGIILVTGGIVLNSLNQFRDSLKRKGLAIALLVSISVVGYSIADGMGSRSSHNSLHYIVWLFALDGWFFLLFMHIKYGWFWGQFTSSDIVSVSFGSLIAVFGYGIVIYAMGFMPFAFVSAIRETSVIIAALIGVLYLKEDGKFLKIFSTIIVFSGIYLIYNN